MWEVPVLKIGTLNPGDSAVTIYWNPVNLLPKQVREVGFSYGLGNVSSGEGAGKLAVTVGGSFAPRGEFTVTAYVSNPVQGQTVSLKLPEDFELIDCKDDADRPAAAAQRHQPAQPGHLEGARPAPGGQIQPEGRVQHRRVADPARDDQAAGHFRGIRMAEPAALAAGWSRSPESGYAGWHALRYSEGRGSLMHGSHALRSTSGRATPAWRRPSCRSEWRGSAGWHALRYSEGRGSLRHGIHALRSTSGRATPGPPHSGESNTATS